MLRDNRLRFDPALRVGEDTIFLSLCLSYSTRVFVARRVLYRQRMHTGSAVARYENDPEAKLENKLALLSARRALTEDISTRRGISVYSCWQGSVVMSYMELCFMFARRASGTGFRSRYQSFLRYAKDPGVSETLSRYPPLRRVSVRNIPFWLMKRRLHGILFLCAAFLNLTNFKFIRE